MDFFLGITNRCNLKCPWCAHKRLRELNPLYEMTIKEYETWYKYTKRAMYRFESIDFNGLGEPTIYSDIDLLVYMIIRAGAFTDSVNILTNGTRPDIIRKILPFCNHITVSYWMSIPETEELEKIYPTKIHLRKNIPLHDVSSKYTEGYSDKLVECGCSGCGYTMDTIFLVCGTWCPEIRKDNLYHTELRENYLDTLNKSYGKTAFEMCHHCHANTSIEPKMFSLDKGLKKD